MCEDFRGHRNRSISRDKLKKQNYYLDVISKGKLELFGHVLP